MSDDDYDTMLSYFTNFDSKNSGALDLNEFTSLVRHLGFHNISPEEVKKGFEKIDTDNNNQIDFDEFMAWWGDQ